MHMTNNYVGHLNRIIIMQEANQWKSSIYLEAEQHNYIIIISEIGINSLPCLLSTSEMWRQKLPKINRARQQVLVHVHVRANCDMQFPGRSNL